MLTTNPKYSKLYNVAFNSVKRILKEIPPSHGYEHANLVAKHVDKATHPQYEPDLTDETRFNLILIGLCHDLDDRKTFPQHSNNENTREVLNELQINNNDTIYIIDGINLVSASKNGDSIPQNYSIQILIPRYIDRGQAIGPTGVLRTYQYTKEVEMKLYTPETIRANSEEELYQLVTKQRYYNYCTVNKGVSASMIDHIYDKLMWIHEVPPQITNQYVLDYMESNKQTLIDLVILFGRQGYLTEAQILSFTY